jgi:REP element-mobilizing transposase RayT
MAIRKLHQLTDNTWFITFTCHDWLPLFETTKSYDLIYNWLKLIDEKHHVKTLSFVIMPNHAHVLVYLTDLGINLNKLLSNGKRFMAYELIKRLTANREDLLLNKLSIACSEKEKAKGQKHKVFEPSFDAKEIYSLEFLNQKLDYIHNNPVSGRWNLAREYTDYIHSSAAFYIDEKPNEFIDITDYRIYWG